jgi:hypothetical protein
MILIDAGPLVALFRTSDNEHKACDAIFKSLKGPFATTLPVVTEAFHLLSPASPAAGRLRAFLRDGAAAIVDLSALDLENAFDLMEEYADLPMDFADASLIAAAETLKTLKIFTFDKRDFGVYRIRRGGRRWPVSVV